MATIKSYTDIEQSHKLAEILPLESADMYYEPSAGFCTEPSEAKFGNIKYAHPRSIRCWSLAALLGVLPNPSLHKVYTGWRCDTYNENCTQCQLGNTADTPIDACYEMIIKLHEQKLL